MAKRIVSLVLALVLLCPAAFAAGEEGGWLFRMTPEGELPEDAQVQIIHEGERVYRTDDWSLVRALEEQGRLEYWEPNGSMELADYQEDVSKLSAETWTRAMLGADYAVEREILGEGVRVAVIDSGLAPDYAERTHSTVIPGVNYTVSEGSLKRNDTTDEQGHGTFVSSIISSAQFGLAPGVELVPLKCFGTGGSSEATVSEAIYAAVDVFHCQVLNLSVGGKVNYTTLGEAVEYALDHGAVVVAAAGNLRKGKPSTGNDPLFYPGSYDGVISVGSVDQKKKIADHSSQNDHVWITAPGLSVPGLSWQTMRVVNDSGTSFATPMVSAAAALALSADPELTPTRIGELLGETAQDLGATGRDNTFGYGLLNLGLFLATVTRDCESVVPSWYDNKLCLSAFRPAEDGAENWIASYGEEGRFLSLTALTETLNNRPFSQEEARLKLLTLDMTTFSPLCPAASYGFPQAAPETEEEEAQNPS